MSSFNNFETNLAFPSPKIYVDITEYFKIFVICGFEVAGIDNYAERFGKIYSAYLV